LHNIPVSQYPVIKNGTIQLFIAGTLENDSILIRAKAKIHLQSALRIKDILEQQQQKKTCTQEKIKCWMCLVLKIVKHNKA